jgi:hypothetical protein
MTHLLNRRPWLVTAFWFLAIQGVVFAALWSAFGGEAIFTSQNSLYHAVFGDHYVRTRSSLDQMHLLEVSRFGVHFVDQHFGFNVIVGFLGLVLGAETGLAFWTIFTLGLVIFSVGLNLRDSKVQWPFIIAMGMIFVCAPAYERYLWARPTALFTACLFLQMWNALFRRNFWLSFALMAVAMTFSYGALIFIPVTLICKLTMRRPRQETRRSVLAMVAGLLVGICISINPMENFIYLASLSYHLFFKENNINEWLPNAKVIKDSLLGEVMLLASMYLFFYHSFPRDVRKLLKCLNILTLIFFVLFIQVTRFDHLFLVFSGIAFLVSVTHSRNFSRLESRCILSVVIIFCGIQGVAAVRSIANNFVMRPQVNIQDFRKFTRWYVLSWLKDKKIALLSWEHWPAILYLNRGIRAEPGYSPFLYDIRFSEFSATIEKMRSQDPIEVSAALRRYLEFLETDILLVHKSNRQYPLIRKLPDLQIQYEDVGVVLYKKRLPQTPEEELERDLNLGNATEFLKAFGPTGRVDAGWDQGFTLPPLALRLEWSWQFMQRLDRGLQEPYFEFNPRGKGWIAAPLAEQAYRLRAFAMYACQTKDHSKISIRTRRSAAEICRSQAAVISRELMAGGWNAPHFISLAMSALEMDRAKAWKIPTDRMRRELDLRASQVQRSLSEHLASVGFGSPPEPPIKLAVTLAALSRFYRYSPADYASLNIFLEIQPQIMRFIRDIPHFFIIRWLAEAYANAYFVDPSPKYLDVLKALWDLARSQTDDRTWFDGNKTNCVGGYVPGVGNEPLPTNTTALMAEGFSYWLFAEAIVEKRIAAFRERVHSYLDCYSYYQVTPALVRSAGISRERTGSFIFSPHANWSRVDTQGHAHQALLNLVK